MIKKYLPPVLFFLLLLFVGIIAITQEAPQDELGYDDLELGDIDFEFPAEEDGEMPPEWIPPGPPRWFKSNAGGMTLEETPSRLAALRGKYALVIDYSAPYDIDPRLLPFYRSDYTAEIRILYEQGQELRRQWLFLDETGLVRLNAVFKPLAEDGDLEIDLQSSGDDQADADAEAEMEAALEAADDDEDESFQPLEGLANAGGPDEGAEGPENDGGPDDLGEAGPAASPRREEPASIGFIEIFNENAQLAEDRWLFDDDSELHVGYFYNGSTLVQSQTRRKAPDSAYHKLYTDNYRYNRSYSLRYVERLYHEGINSEGVNNESADDAPWIEPVRLAFPSRVLDAALNDDFLSEKLFISPEFFGGSSVAEGYRMVYDTDGRGRILTQTMFDSDDEIVWVVKNTWLGDRITASLRTEDGDEKLTEYEYDAAGNRIVQRDINNGVLERVIFSDGAKETEELYMNGEVVLRAYWESGRKISEERVRVRQR